MSGWRRGGSKLYGLYIRNYDQAVACEANIKPIRGKPDCKPLGERRKTWMTIRKQSVEGQELPDIVVRLHSSDIVSFKPGGHIHVSNGGWASTTTHDVMQAVLGVSVTTHQNSTWVQTTAGWMPLRKAHARDGAVVEENIFWRDADGPLSAVNINYPTITRVNKTEANIVRKAYAPFRKYMHGLIKLRDHEPFANEFPYRTNLANVTEDIDSNDPAVWAQVVINMSHRCVEWIWDYPLRTRTGLISLTRMDKLLTETIYAGHKEKVFYQEEVRTGKFVVDKWRRVANHV